MENAITIALCCFQAFILNRYRSDLFPWLLLAQTVAPLYDEHRIRYKTYKELQIALIQGVLHALSIFTPMLAGELCAPSIDRGNRTLTRSIAPIMALALFYRDSTVWQWVTSLVAYVALLGSTGTSIDYLETPECILAHVLLLFSSFCGVLLGVVQREGAYWTEMTLVSSFVLAISGGVYGTDAAMEHIPLIVSHTIFSVYVHRRMRTMLDKMRQDPVSVTVILSTRRALTVLIEKWFVSGSLLEQILALLAVLSSIAFKVGS